MLPDNFFFPCPAVLNGADSPYHESARTPQHCAGVLHATAVYSIYVPPARSAATAVAAARQLHGHGPHVAGFFSPVFLGVVALTSRHCTLYSCWSPHNITR